MQYDRRLENARFAILTVLLAACFMMGGASRLDVMSLIVLQPLAALCIVAFMLVPGSRDWGAVRMPLLFLCGLASVIAAQLVPLPPALWSQLSGHAQFVQGLVAAEIEPVWRPMSLTPDLTLASLVGLIIPLAMLVGIASIAPRHRQSLLLVMIIGSVASALFGLAQVSSGGTGPFYLYDITNFGAAVGLFSNRNHQALLLAMTWPMLATWAMQVKKDRRARVAAQWVAAGFAVFLLPMLLVTGSRAGLLLGIVALGAAAWIWRSAKLPASSKKGRFERLIGPLVGLFALVVLLATLFLSRATAIQRLFGGAGDEVRVEAMPTLLQMARDFFPIGSGFGSFDPVFRFYEPFALVNPQYLNHAHNDVLELVITGGIAGVAIGLGFSVWLMICGFRAWRDRRQVPGQSLARLGCVMVCLVLAGSLVDYPMRTPLMMAIVAVCCGWIGAYSEQRERQSEPA